MAEATEKNSIEIPDYLTVRDLAELMGASPIDVIKELMRNGIMASITQQIDYETAAIVAAEMGFEPRAHVVVEEEESTEDLPEWRHLYDGEDPKKLIRRPPVVTILGHVDHGKTSLLDKIRQTNVQAGEAGGITQHIGAYQVEIEGRKITFLDTPGHEAFTAMRSRGAKGADIAVLVVAADDGVMPQTKEAISHVRAAHVPIVVALNKMDKANANPDFVKQQLADNGLVSDEWDGDTLVIPVSAVTGDGIDELLEAILLVAEDIEITANPGKGAAGTVLEANMDHSRGVMATLLVQNGTLRKGDTVLAGEAYGRLKAMFNEWGEDVAEAGPSMPVSVLGLNNAPAPGTLFNVVKNEKEARKIIEERSTTTQRAVAERRPLSLEDLYARLRESEVKELNLIVKTDVQGSLEPVTSGLGRIRVQDGEHELKVNILHADIGNVSESDVMLAFASDAVIVGFQVGVDNSAQRRADSDGVEIRLYDVIYKLFEDIELSLNGMLEPVYEDKVIGVAEIRQVFRIPKIGKVAGSYVIEGEARRDARARVIRNSKQIHEGKVTSLKRFQEDVREVRTGFECGINVDGFDNFQEGDRIEFILRERVR